MRICLIFNPNAGTADRIKDVLLHLTGNHRCELRPTSKQLGARQIAREAIEQGFDRLVVAGGDGTVSEAVNGMAPDFDAIELAVLPFGTGNDLARVLGVSGEQLEAACDFAFGTHIEAIDIMSISGDDGETYCVNVANGGLGGRVAVDVLHDDKQRWGSMAYWMTSITRIAELQPFHVDLWLDDKHKNIDALGLAIANGRYVGGGFPIAPQAMLNDGLLDITICPVLPMFELMAAGMNFTLGEEHRDDRIQQFQAKRVRVQSEPDMPFSIDGETSTRIDATFQIIPSALRVVTGSHAEGLQPASSTGPFIS